MVELGVSGCVNDLFTNTDPAMMSKSKIIINCHLSLF